MNEVILKVLSGRASPGEKEQLGDWRAQSAANEREFQEAARVWEVTGLVGPPMSDRVPSGSEIMARGARSDYSSRGRLPGGRSHAWRWQVAAMAASLVAGLGLAQFFLGPLPLQNSPIEVVTAAGEQASVLLPDGTVLRLGPKSRVRAALLRGSREVTLDGQAYFAVAHDPGRPFTVRAEAGEAVVLGTRFQVSARAGEMLVAVLEGRVAVTAAGESVILEAGDVRRARADVPPAPVPPEDLAALKAWLGTFAAYQATPLREVAMELRQRFGLQVIFADPSLEDRTLTAWFPDSDLEGMLSVICRVTDVTCTHLEGVLTISQ